MEESKAKTESPVEDEPERSDMELRNPSVVLSVRLDDATTRQLHRIAKRRGVRLSDVLREAAIAYASADALGSGVRVVIEGGVQHYPVQVALGTWPVSSESQRARRGSATLEWPERPTEPVPA
jgi:predicted DNA-binding ribbon-helix-helix protein